MKNKKSIAFLGAFAILIVLTVLSLVPISSSAASSSTAHYHPVCGTSCTCTESHAGKTWQPFPSGTTTLTSGNYYLTSSINFTGSDQLVISGNVSLCLNGYSINKNGTSTVVTVSSGTLTLSDCKGTGKISVTSSDKGSFSGGGALALRGDGSLALYGGSVSCDALGDAICCGTTGNLSIHGGDVTAYNTAIEICKVNDISVSAGNIIGSRSFGISCGEPSYNPAGTFHNIIISGGYFEGVRAGVSLGKFTCSGAVKISGGEFYGKGPVPNSTTYSSNYYGFSFSSSGGGSCNLTVSGGTFRGARGGFYNFNPLLNASISGGTFESPYSYYSSGKAGIYTDGGTFHISGGIIYGIQGHPSYNEYTNIIVTGGEILCIQGNSSSSGTFSLKVFGGIIGRAGTTTASAGIVASTMTDIDNPANIEIYQGTIVGTKYAIEYSQYSANPGAPLLVAGGSLLGDIADIYTGAYGTTAENAPISMEGYTGSTVTIQVSSSVPQNTYIAKNVSQNGMISMADRQYSAVYSNVNKAVFVKKHTYQSTVTAPTCDKAGYTTYTCSVCGEGYRANEVAARGHAMQDATCLLPATCTVCGHTEGEAFGHYILVDTTETVDALTLTNATNYPFTYANDWYTSTNKSHSTTSTFTITAKYATTLVIKYSVSSESNYDKLTIAKNGTTLDTLSGVVSNKSVTVTLAAGDYVTVKYSKDGSVSKNSDNGSFTIVSGAQTTTGSTERVPVTEFEPTCTEGIVCDDCEAVIIPALGHNYGEWVEVAIGEEQRVCQNDPLHIETRTTTVVLKISGAYLNLSDNINLFYTVTVPAGYENPYMVFEMNGESYTVTDYILRADGKLAFAFGAVRPQYFGDSIKATLYASYDGETYSNEKASYSVREYCANQLIKYATNEKLVRVVSDILAYGDATQAYLGYKTDSLSSATVNYTPSTFISLDSTANKKALTGEKDDRITWKSAGVRLENTLAIYVRFKTTEAPENVAIRFTVAGKSVTAQLSRFTPDEEGYYTVYVRGIAASELNETFTATFLVNGEAVGQTLNYSVNSYIYANQNSTNTALSNLVRALYVYGESAKVYAAE